VISMFQLQCHDKNPAQTSPLTALIQYKFNWVFFERWRSMWFILRAEICLKGKGLKCSPTLYTCSPKIDQEQQQIERRKR
jgi:hypothetical protein